MPLTGPGKKSILAQCRLSNLQLQPIQPPRPFPLRRLSLVRPTCPLDTGTLTWFFCGNKNFLRFWLAGVISQLGNWFNYIAIFVLLNELTGSGAAVSWFLIAKFMPTAILAPVSGVIADRFSRRKIMIFCDVSRIFVVLGFLLVREPGQVWLILPWLCFRSRSGLFTTRLGGPRCPISVDRRNCIWPMFYPAPPGQSCWRWVCGPGWFGHRHLGLANRHCS